MAASRWRQGVFALVLLVTCAGGMAQVDPSTKAPIARMPGMTGPVSTLPALDPVSTSTTPAPLATPQFRRYGVDEGVLRGSVYAVAQDRHGLMWFGSAAGLMRYDGVSFQAFRNAPDDPRSLPANQSYALYVDRDNKIWAGGISTGLIVYDQLTERFQQWTHDDAKPSSLADNEVWGMTQTTDGQLWVATGEGLDRMRKDGQGFDHVPLDIDGTHAASFGETRALLSESDGRLWIGTAKGLYLRSAGGRLRRIAIDPAFHGNPGKIWRIEGGLADPQQREVRVAIDGGLLIIHDDLVAHPFAPQVLSSLRVVSSTRDAQSRLWIATVSGMLLDEGNGRLQPITGQPLLPGGLPSNKIWQTMLDREGGLWITFDQSSVAYLPPAWNGFTRFTHIPDDPNSLSGIAASAMAFARDGLLWVGGNDGWIDKLDVGTGTVTHVIRDMHTQIIAMAEDPRGRLWIVSSGALHVLDHGKLIAVPAGDSPMQRPVLIVVADDGTAYVASWGGGVVAVNPETLAITPLRLEAGASPSVTDDTLLPEQISFHAGTLWYVSNGGLLRWDASAKEFVFVPGVPQTTVRGAAFDATGFWLLESSTIAHYRYASGRAVRDDIIDFKHEPFVSDLVDMQVDRLGHLWLLANPGLFRFDAVSRRFQSFGPSQGLSNADFSGAMVAEDGTIFATNSAGVLMFQPEHLTAMNNAAASPPLILTRVSVRREGDVYELPLAGSAISLGWRDRDLRVDVRAASFISPKGNHYRFKLGGFDNGWVNVDSRGERDFAGLPAGNYTLHVQGAGENSAWSSLPTPLRISVQAPPWNRWWAWASYVLMILFTAGLVLRGWRRRLAQRHRMQMIEQQRQLAEAASAAKTQFLATLSHEIRTPMTGVMGMAELMLTTPLTPLQHDYTKAMQRSGGMLLKLLNDALDLARIEAGRLELEPAPFDPRQLLDDVSQLEQGLAHMKGIRFVLDVAPDLPKCVIGDAVRIKQVLLNLANNALKFTERGSVTLRAQRTAQGLVFSISDTGPGIPEASRARLFQRFEQEDGPHRGAGSGLGLAICRELVEMMSGSIELESRVGHGSSFHVRLPLSEPAPVQHSPAVATAHRRYRLLLVEDDTIIAAVISGLLEQQGHTVRHVANGLAALAELGHASFDAVLLDLDLPGVDGFQIARLIRQREHDGQRLPIVAVTARSGSEDEMRAQAAGMDDFLRKPLSGEQLAQVLARVIARTQEVTDDEP
ncbi:signal transduction histidine kinase/streptogramin lyase/ActR/RegA family two-component response regulator [Rhodanobacter sp. K2T2]|uniref:hybrid sensor histidine kinase/response regulator n=1 Tax=Rhodanobacter sp. K2T2 TaxID=2723085 RepID=UPI0017D725DC|nr:hybrid sensor histidine kinase/response regulator [Rhodanobacter sp. K2T2]NYE30863.1 signal transduction histidine kinase/streptogramin lyase/ActR/RegA family two-component response regulator [Rhodanobacter sp. K2T2]